MPLFLLWSWSVRGKRGVAGNETSSTCSGYPEAEQDVTCLAEVSGVCDQVE